VTFERVLQILSILEPIVLDVDKWLEGSSQAPPESLQNLPASLKSDVELRLLKARVENAGASTP